MKDKHCHVVISAVILNLSNMKMQRHECFQFTAVTPSKLTKIKLFSFVIYRKDSVTISQVAALVFTRTEKRTKSKSPIMQATTFKRRARDRSPLRCVKRIQRFSNQSTITSSRTSAQLQKRAVTQ